jgi:hypothetical protein
LFIFEQQNLAEEGESVSETSRNDPPNSAIDGHFQSEEAQSDKGIARNYFFSSFSSSSLLSEAVDAREAAVAKEAEAAEAAAAKKTKAAATTGVTEAAWTADKVAAKERHKLEKQLTGVLSWDLWPLSRGVPQWQMLDADYQSFVYSAHYDDVSLPPLVRVVGFFARTWAHRAPISVKCRFWKSGRPDGQSKGL